MSERVKCIEIVERDSNLVREFSVWRKATKRKIKSKNRLAYLFLKSKFGTDWIRLMRKIRSQSDLVRIVKTPWIKVEE